MASATQFPMTHQGVRDLDNPVRPASKKVNVGPNERMASSLGGAVLAGAGVGQGGLMGLALAVLGASLIYRGQTGHCSLYSATGVNTAK